MSACSDCGHVFHTAQALHAHCRDKKDHFYCEDCERLFVHYTALLQHLQNSSVHRDNLTTGSDDENEDEDEGDAYCADCGLTFAHLSALLEHLNNAPVHQNGSSDDNDSQDGERATYKEDSDEDPFCSSCNRWFVDKQSLHQHLASNFKHNWCFSCSRDFVDKKALEQHSSSRVHNARDNLCPLCSKAFKVPSAVALHIESGACNNISRHQVTAAIHSVGIVPTISISRRLDEAPIVAGNHGVHHSATEKAFNGSAYECYICHRTFRTLHSLNAHLESPAHDKAEFRCPGCGGTYKLISGLVQHIESEVCGVGRFKQVKNYATALSTQFSRLLT